MILSVGTAKGLFLFRSDESRRRWRRSGPHLKGLEINHAIVDPRSGDLFATANSPWFGSRMSRSTNNGRTWQESEVKFGDEEQKLDRVWHIEPGRPSEPDTIFLGVAPAALFRSDDRGESWSEVKGLTEHPSRDRWQPGAGGLCLHSIVLDPDDASKVWIGISAVGVFRTEDGGDKWETKNAGVRAEFQPEKYPEFGQCVHHMVRAANGRLYQQNHCGVYRSDDGGDSWDEITEGLPSDFGFPMAAHPRDPDTAYVIPLQGAEFRGPPEGKLRVFRTTDAGKSWEPLTQGLPQSGAFMGIYREGMTADSLDPCGIYFGTNTGNLYASIDEGESWRRLSAELPPITSVSVSV